MGRFVEMAQAFSDYSVKFADNQSKRVSGLVKAADAYYNLKDYVRAEKTYLAAIDVYEKFKKKADIDMYEVSKAYFKIAEMRFDEFEKLKLDGPNEKEITRQLKEKTKALEPVLRSYANVIELGIAEWTVRSTYRIGESFLSMAEAFKNQRLLGSQEQQVASRIKIISGLEKYYIKAQEKFAWNIETAYTQGIDNEWVHKSIDEFMKMAYDKGALLEQIGEIFKNAPVPKDLSPEDKSAYRDVLEEKYLEALDAALPKFEEGIMAAKELGIAENQWLDKIREKVRFINPNSAVLAIQITPRKIVQAEVAAGKKEDSRISSAGGKSRDEQYDRNMRRIQNISKMNIGVSEMVIQLRSIENDAKRAAEKEQERIVEIKKMLQAK
jgi:hypothetical protein